MVAVYTSFVVNTLIKNGAGLLSRGQTSILSAALVIMVAYGISGLLGLARDRLLAKYFFSGQEAQLDAYFAAFVLPDTIFQLLILGALSAAFIPVFTEYLHRRSDEAWLVASASMTELLTLFVGLSATLFIFAASASRLIAPDFPLPLIQVMTNLIRIMLAAQFFFALSSFMTGVLQSHHRFMLPAIAPVFYNLGIIAGIVFLSPIAGIYGPAIGVVIGALLHFLVQLPLAIKLGFRFRFSYAVSHPGVMRIRRLMPARAATLAIGQLERIIAVRISSALAAGTLAIFNFARQLYLYPIILFGTTMGQASFPSLSHAREEGGERFTNTIITTLLQVLFFAFPAAVLLLVLRIPAVRLIFGARQFPWEATLLTGKAVALFALSVPSQSINQLLTRAFYACQNTKTPLAVALASTLFIVFAAPMLATGLGWGVLGVVAAIVVADVLNSLILLFFLNRLYARGAIRRMAGGVAAMLLATSVMGVSLWVPLRLLDKFVFDTTRTLPLIGLTAIVSGIGIIIYLLLSKLLAVAQLQLVIRLFHRIGNWREVLAESEEALEPTVE